jgi:hypothetical protein
MIRNVLAAFFLTLFSAGFVGCSKDLPRSSAADLIKQRQELSAVIEVKVPVGNMWLDWRDVNDDPILKPLKDHGILTVRESGQNQGVWYKEYLFELTPGGKDLSKSWVLTKEKVSAGNAGSTCWTPQTYSQGEPCHKPSGVIYSIVLARRKINEVSGIKMDPGGKEADVEFIWEWVPTADAKIFADRVPAGMQEGQATFQLYDDGWRITQIALR